MDKSTGPPGPHHAHRTCSAVESTAMKLSAHTASADVNVRGVWTLIEVMYLVNPLCTGCEPLWFLNTRTLQSHLQLIVEYLGHCTGIQWAVYEAWKEKRLHVFRLWWPGRLRTFTVFKFRCCTLYKNISSSMKWSFMLSCSETRVSNNHKHHFLSGLFSVHNLYFILFTSISIFYRKADSVMIIKSLNT